MANYFIDCKFLEGTQNKTVLGIKYGKTKPTIDLISIGIVSEDGREYYAISKDFNLKEAWNRYDIRKEWYSIDESTQSTRDVKVYWIRENVLKSIHTELLVKRDKVFKNNEKEARECLDILYFKEPKNMYKELKYLIKTYGKPNKQIAEEIKEFVGFPNYYPKNSAMRNMDTTKPEFYGYYSDYDWVALCWLFGKMIDLPTGFPMYAFDLKQELDRKISNLQWLYGRDIWSNSNRSIKTIGKGQQQEKDREATFDEKLKVLKELVEYPKQTNKHNSLADARFNKQLYDFLNKLKV